MVIKGDTRSLDNGSYGYMDPLGMLQDSAFCLYPPIAPHVVNTVSSCEKADRWGL